MMRLLSHFAIPRKPQYQMLGLYHCLCKEKLNLAREQFGRLRVKLVIELYWKSFMSKSLHVACCGACGKPLVQLKPLIIEEGGMHRLKNHRCINKVKSGWCQEGVACVIVKKQIEHLF